MKLTKAQFDLFRRNRAAFTEFLKKNRIKGWPQVTKDEENYYLWT